MPAAPATLPHEVKHFLRQDDGRWLYTKADGLDEALALPTVNCHLALKDVCRKAI